MLAESVNFQDTGFMLQICVRACVPCF